MWHCTQWNSWEKALEDTSLSQCGPSNPLVLLPAEMHILSKFPSKHCAADTVCPLSQWGWQCWSQTNRFKSTNLPSRGCSSFLEICHWGIFWLNLSRHLLFTDIALLTGGITEVVLHWQYPLAQCQSDSSSTSLQGPKTAAAVRGLQLLWSVMIKLYLLISSGKYSFHGIRRKVRKMKSLAMHYGHDSPDLHKFEQLRSNQ